MGGAALHLGNIAEMKTGEGKTLVATTAAYLNALTSRGVHVVTVNDFLASYQSELMGRVFRALGMTTGCIVAGQTPAVRREQYAADITYGTNNEFGFDYLRDNMAWQSSDMVQRGHFFAIVDEVDSILIDEARTPLIISGPASGEANRWFNEFANLAKRLVPGEDYEVDEKKRTVGVLEPGIEKVEDYLGIENLYESANTPLISFLNNSIKAKCALQARQGLRRDERRGAHRRRAHRPHPGRPSLQRGHPPGDRGEGGRAGQGREPDPRDRHAAELLPPLQQAVGHDRYRRDRGGRVHVHLQARRGRRSRRTSPWCASTSPTSSTRTRSPSSRRSSRTSSSVTARASRCSSAPPASRRASTSRGSSPRRASRHEVLNAKNHAREAAIVAQAGRHGAVTVATNMAGRGTDVMLGGNAEFLAVQQMHERGLSPVDTPDEYEAAWDEVFDKVKAEVATEAEKVLAAGGLYVLGTERHESRRIDNQLRGRSGRQGDPGESRFYLSLTDDLMRLFNAGAAESLMSARRPRRRGHRVEGRQRAPSAPRSRRSRRATPRSARTC